MKHYFSDVFKKFETFSSNLDNHSLLQNYKWVLIQDQDDFKHSYIFNRNGRLVYSKSGLVKEGSWECLNSQSIVMRMGHKVQLFKHGFLDKKVLILQLDGNNEIFAFVNESRIDNDLKTLEDIKSFLIQEYSNKKKSVLGITFKNKAKIEKTEKELLREEFLRRRSERNTLLLLKVFFWVFGLAILFGYVWSVFDSKK